MYIPSNVPDKPPVELRQPGAYPYEVVNAEDKKSQAGNDQIKLTLKCWDNEGKEFIVWDYLVDIESMWFKSKHFLQSCNQPFENINLIAHMCMGRCGKLLLGIDKDKTGKYPDKNVVKDYMTLEGAKQVEAMGICPSHPAEMRNDDFDDTPF